MIRKYLDIPYLVGGFLQGLPNKELISREQARLNALGKADIAGQLTKNVLIGLKRDLKEGKIPLHHPKDTATFVYGVEEDNGGIPVFVGERDIVANNVLILNDIHFPFVSWDMMDRVITMMDRQQFDHVILAGDVLNGSAISKWSKLIEQPHFRKEIKTAKEGLKEILARSQAVTYFRGNHEDWYLFQNDGTEDFRTFATRIIDPKYRDRVVISPYDRMWVTSGTERWLIAHQKQISGADKIKIAEQLSWKYLCNVVITHQHKNAGPQRDKYNNFTLVSVGGLHDPEKMDYVQLKTTTAPVQEQGFATISNGRIELWTPEPTVTRW